MWSTCALNFWWRGCVVRKTLFSKWSFKPAAIARPPTLSHFYTFSAFVPSAMNYTRYAKVSLTQSYRLALVEDGVTQTGRCHFLSPVQLFCVIVFKSLFSVYSLLEAVHVHIIPCMLCISKKGQWMNFDFDLVSLGQDERLSLELIINKKIGGNSYRKLA